MMDLAFPARKKYYRTGEWSKVVRLVEVYTFSSLQGPLLTSLGQVSFDGRNVNHYLMEWSRQVADYLLSELELPDPVANHLRSPPEANRQNQTRIMAIANATPDSFYPGSRVDAESAALQNLIDASPDIIDVGGESTRPRSMEVSTEEEISRIRPIIDYLNKNSNIEISLDTRHPEVLEEFAGKVSYINDISAFKEEKMVSLALEHGLKCITMHMRGEPGNMESMTRYTDVLPEVLSFLVHSAENLSEAGIDPKDIFIDPGIGFAKDLTGNLELVRDAGSFMVGYGTLFGTSRKSFLGKITGNDEEGRLPATLATSAYLAAEGIDILRVHDPKENSDVVKVIRKILEAGD